MKFRFIAVVLGCALGCASAADLPSGLVISQRNQEAVLEYLRPALTSRGGAGRIYYSASCAAKDGTPLPFPRVEVLPPAKEKTGLAAVREIFKNDKHVMVSEDRSGMIRVTIGQPAAAILQTRIRSLTLKPDDQYNPALAIAAVGNTKEVEDAKRKLGFKEPLTVFDMNVVKPANGLPHLPSSLENITVDQALDLIAKTFRGIVMYEACAEPRGVRLFSLEFIDVADF